VIILPDRQRAANKPYIEVREVRQIRGVVRGAVGVPLHDDVAAHIHQTIQARQGGETKLSDL